MPWLGANGLLPGRGEPGRPPAAGLPVGRAGGGPGRRVVPVVSMVGRLGAGALGAGASGAEAGAGAEAACSTGGVAGAAGAAGSAARTGSTTSAGCAGPGRGPGRGPPPVDGDSVRGAGTGGAVGRVPPDGADGAAGAARPLPPLAALSSAPNVSENLFTTGGSTVDDADLTNSPISLSLARTTLLSTPSSLASSWTRTLATLLLLVRASVPLLVRGRPDR